MKKVKIISFTLSACLLMLVPAQGQSTSSSPAPKRKLLIEGKFNAMAIDPQGLLYAVSDATLYKYTADGKLLYSYTDNMLGRIHSIDVDNPLKIMVFYQESGSIVFLNDKLAPIGDAIDLYGQGFNTISAATYSTRNELILFDETNNDLLFLDFYFKIKEKIHYGIAEIHPIQMTNISEKMLIIQDAEGGVMFFDHFGTFEKQLNFHTDRIVQVQGDYVYYLKDDSLLRYDGLHLTMEEVMKSPPGALQAFIHRTDVYFLTEEGIIRY